MPAPPARSFSASVPLRRQHQFQLARQHLALEFLVLAHVADAMTFFTCRVLSSSPMPKSSTPGVVADDGQVLGAALDQRLDEVFRDPAEAESARGNGHAVLQQALQRSGRVGVDFFMAARDSVRLRESRG